MLKQTKYVIVVDYSEDNNLLTDNYLLGWNNLHDWFDTDTIGSDIIETDGIKQNEFGSVDITRWVSIYTSDSVSGLIDHTSSANLEGYDCTICRIEKDAYGNWIINKVTEEQ
jgi:hypothetical protein